MTISKIGNNSGYKVAPSPMTTATPLRSEKVYMKAPRTRTSPMMKVAPSPTEYVTTAPPPRREKVYMKAPMQTRKIVTKCGPSPMISGSMQITKVGNKPKKNTVVKISGMLAIIIQKIGETENGPSKLLNALSRFRHHGRDMNVEDFDNAIKQCDIHMERSDVQSAFNQLDFERDGGVTFDEFVRRFRAINASRFAQKGTTTVGTKVVKTKSSSTMSKAVSSSSNYSSSYNSNVASSGTTTNIASGSTMTTSTTSVQQLRTQLDTKVKSLSGATPAEVFYQFRILGGGIGNTMTLAHFTTALTKMGLSASQSVISSLFMTLTNGASSFTEEAFAIQMKHAISADGQQVVRHYWLNGGALTIIKQKLSKIANGPTKLLHALREFKTNGRDISFEDFRLALQQCNISMETEDIQIAFKQIDHDDSGGFTYGEFLRRIGDVNSARRTPANVGTGASITGGSSTQVVSQSSSNMVSSSMTSSNISSSNVSSSINTVTNSTVSTTSIQTLRAQLEAKIKGLSGGSASKVFYQFRILGGGVGKTMTLAHFSKALMKMGITGDQSVISSLFTSLTNGASSFTYEMFARTLGHAISDEGTEVVRHYWVNGGALEIIKRKLSQIVNGQMKLLYALKRFKSSGQIITFNDFRGAFETIGIPMDQTELEKAFLQLNHDDNNGVTYLEFVRRMFGNTPAKSGRGMTITSLEQFLRLLRGEIKNVNIDTDKLMELFQMKTMTVDYFIQELQKMGIHVERQVAISLHRQLVSTNFSFVTSMSLDESRVDHSHNAKMQKVIERSNLIDQVAEHYENTVMVHAPITENVKIEKHVTPVYYLYNSSLNMGEDHTLTRAREKSKKVEK